MRNEQEIKEKIENTDLDKVAIANAYNSFDSQLKLITIELINNQ